MSRSAPKQHGGEDCAGYFSSARIVALVTAGSARQRGVGKLLVARAMHWARENGCVRLSVTSAIEPPGADH